MEQVWDWALDAGIDALKLAPFLLITLLLLEYLEHRAGKGLSKALQRSGRFGPAVGAALGCVPQCGFSVAAAHLYNAGMVTAGTLAAVFLSTSDEAIPILLAGGAAGEIGRLILAKIAIALLAGFLLDAFWKPGRTLDPITPEEHAHECHGNGSLWSILWEAVKHTLGILFFLFVATFILNGAIGLIGEERLGSLFLSNSLWQPVVAGLFGLIPNCAASVLLTEFYLEGAISFGSAVAGLGVGAGLGLLELIRSRRGWKSCLVPLAVVYAAAVAAGMLLQVLA